MLRDLLHRPISLPGQFVRKWWLNKLTPAGQWILGGVAVSMIGLRSLMVPAYGVFCALAALYVVARVAGFLFRPRVAIKYELPDKAVTGCEVHVKVEVTNQSRWRTFDVSVDLLDAPASWDGTACDEIEPVLSPGDSCNFLLRFTPQKRGTFPWPAMRVFSTFPFNLFRSGAARPLPGYLVVVPSFEPLQQIDPGFGSRMHTHEATASIFTGNSAEYLGNRDYMPGDSLRKLDFRSWARLGKPYVREYQEESYGRVALILDTYISETNRKRRIELEDAFEAAVELTAAAADALSRDQISLEIFAAGPELYIFRSNSTRTSIDTVLEVLAGVQSARENTFAKVAAALVEQLDEVSTAICILLDWDDARNTLAEEIMHAGCGLKVVVVRDGPTTRPLESSEELALLDFTPEQVRRGRVNAL